MADDTLTPERLAELFHATYERLAPSFGYQTRPASATAWANVPEPNKSLMIAVAAEVIAAVRAEVVDGGAGVSRPAVDAAERTPSTPAMADDTVEAARQDLIEDINAIASNEAISGSGVIESIDALIAAVRAEPFWWCPVHGSPSPCPRCPQPPIRAESAPDETTNAKKAWRRNGY